MTRARTSHVGGFRARAQLAFVASLVADDDPQRGRFDGHLPVYVGVEQRPQLGQGALLSQREGVREKVRGFGSFRYESAGGHPEVGGSRRT